MRGLVFIALSALACGAEPIDPAPVTANPTGLLAEPASGRQVVTESRTIAAGREQTYCYYVDLHADAPIDVVAFETAHAGPLHHFNVFASTLERPEGFAACPDSIDLFVGARPILDGSGSDVRYVFPGDVAFRLEPGTRLIFQLHWINATPAPQESKYVVNLVTRPELVDPVLADVYGFSHFGLEIPAHSKATFEKGCRVDDPMRILSMSAHFHARGTEAVGVVQRKSGENERVYSTDRWDDPLVASFDPPLTVSPDDVLSFSCAYDTRADHVVKYGPKADDEMCFMFGYYTPRRGLWPCL